MTSPEPISVGFSLDASVSDLQNGVLEITGVLHFDGASLEIEYRTTGMSLDQSAVRTVRIDAAELTGVRFRSGLFGSRLIFTSRRLGTFEALPGDHADRLVLSVKRASRAAARNLASLFELGRR